MNNTNDLINRGDAIDAVYERIRQIGYENNLSVLSIRQAIRDLPSAQSEQRGLSGWICPVCGRGVSPFTSVCPCNNGKGWEITC